jgi:proteasome lid subunit RPN8/RPN11
MSGPPDLTRHRAAGAMAHGLELDPSTLGAVIEHAERDFPREACGVIAGRPGRSRLERVCALRNVQDRYHARDPMRYPRTSRDGFRVDELERLRLLERFDVEGLVERVVYHSHCDAAAYFSTEDRAMAVIDGLEVLPGLVHLVVAIRAGRAVDAAAFAYDSAERRFAEVRVPVAEVAMGWPDLLQRAIAGPSPWPPVVRCLATPAEAEWARHHAAGTLQVPPSVVIELRRLALGYWSPSLGFGDGGPTLDEIGRQGHVRDDVVLLCVGNEPLAALRLGEGRALTGEVLVFAAALEPGDLDVADVRAELARRGSASATASRGAHGRLTIFDAAGHEVAATTLAGHPVDEVCVRLAAMLGATLVPGRR